MQSLHYIKNIYQKGEKKLLYETYKKYRDKKKLTDSEVQKKTGISQQYMFGWKHKDYQPTAKKIEPIAKLLNIPLNIAVRYEKDEDK